jgi:uncharacterized membrane protein
MSDLERRSGSGMSRRRREQRAYNLVMAGGVFGVIFVVTGLLAAILAVLCVVMFRRAVR